MYRADIFCEDRGHERFCVPLLERIAAEVGVQVRVETRCSAGGHGRAITELKAYQRFIEKGGATAEGAPDLLVVVIDGNCTTWNKMRDDIDKVVNRNVFPRVVIGCPDPHVERWFFSDRLAFLNVIGVDPPADPGKCERGQYKDLLVETIRKSGNLVQDGGIEFATEIAEALDLNMTTKSQPALRAFLSDLRAALHQMNVP